MSGGHGPRFAAIACTITHAMAIATNTKLESPNATEIALFVRPLRLPALLDSAA